jgi:uncharacterized membrane protein YcaP (DUF421 family)
VAAIHPPTRRAGPELREQNVEDLAEIKLATLEGDGRLSVLKRK